MILSVKIANILPEPFQSDNSDYVIMANIPPALLLRQEALLEVQLKINLQRSDLLICGLLEANFDCFNIKQDLETAEARSYRTCLRSGLSRIFQRARISRMRLK